MKEQRTRSSSHTEGFHDVTLAEEEGEDLTVDETDDAHTAAIG